MNRRMALAFGVFLAVGAAVVVVRGSHHRTPRRLASYDVRCRGGCTETALLRVLQGVPSSRVASGSLTNSRGQAVTDARASNKTCTTAATFDPSNLSSNPERLDLWQTQGQLTVVTPNAAPAPDGTFTATLLGFNIPSAGAFDTNCSASTGLSASAVVYTGSIYVKAGTATDTEFAIVDANAGFARLASTTVALSAGWQRVVVTTSGPATAGNRIGLILWSATSSGTLYAWGGKLEVGSSATAYVPGNNQVLKTLSSNQICVESNGISIEDLNTNLALNSDDPTQWAASEVTLVSGFIAPNGSGTAVKAFETATAGAEHQLYQSLTTTVSTPYVHSAYLKAGTRTWAYFKTVSGPATRSWFNLATCTPGTIASGNTAYTENLGGGWCRISLAIGASNIGGTSTFFVVAPATGDSVSTYTGTTSDYLYAWAIDVVQSAMPPTSHISTGATTAARAADSIASPMVAGLLATKGCIKACFTPKFTGAPSVAGVIGNVFGTATWQTQFIPVSTSNVSTTDGTTATPVGTPYVQGVTRCYLTEWNAATNSNRLTALDTNAQNTNAFSTFPASTSPHSFVAGGGGTNGWIRSIVVGKGPGQCGGNEAGYTYFMGLGDSITMGNVVGTANAWPNLLQGVRGSSFYVWNQGNSGDTAGAMLSRWNGTIGGYQLQYLGVMGGVNDAQTGVPSATAIANLTSIWDSARAKGIKVVLMTVTPCGGWATCDATAQTTVTTINTAINAYNAAHPTDTRVVNVNGLLRDGTLTNQLAVGYDNGDHLHPNAAAELVIANAVNAVVPF